MIYNRQCLDIEVSGRFGLRVEGVGLSKWDSCKYDRSNLLNSHTGRRPAKAAPTAIPAKPISVIGVYHQDSVITWFGSNAKTHVDDTVLSKFVQQTLGDLPSASLFPCPFPSPTPAHLVSTVVSRDFLSNNKDSLVTQHFLLHSSVQRLSHSLTISFHHHAPCDFSTTYHGLLTFRRRIPSSTIDQKPLDASGHLGNSSRVESRTRSKAGEGRSGEMGGRSEDLFSHGRRQAGQGRSGGHLV